MLFGSACLKRLVSGDTDLRDKRSGTHGEEALVFDIGWRSTPMAKKPLEHIIAAKEWCVEGEG